MKRVAFSREGAACLAVGSKTMAYKLPAEVDYGPSEVSCRFRSKPRSVRRASAVAKVMTPNGIGSFH